MDLEAQLEELKKTIQETKQPQRRTVRTILGWAGYQRRGVHVSAEIERKFAEHGLRSTPPFSEPYVDAEVAVSLLNNDDDAIPAYDLLIARIGHLDEANQVPCSVKRDHELGLAMASMVKEDFSQLPVMPNERSVEGYVSWKTIGEAHALGTNPTHVRDCFERDVQIVEARTPLTDAIDLIVKHDFVMVRGPDGKITGPVTTTDLSQRYHVLAQPFLLIGQIESSIRKVLDAHAPLEVLKAAKFGDDDRQVKRPEDLTFSEYKAALGHDDVWPNLKLNIAKSEVMKLLESVRLARNDIMHFHPDDSADDALRILRSAARTFDKIAKAVVPRSPLRARQ